MVRAKWVTMFFVILVLSPMLQHTSYGLEDNSDIDYEVPKMGFVKKDTANVRAGDNINYEVLCVLRKGDPVKIVGERYSWFKIILPRYAYLYIKSDFVDLDESDNTKGYVNASHVNLRAGPDTRYTILGQVSRPQALVIISEDNGWYKIEPPDNMKGWIHSDLISFDMEPQTTKDNIPESTIPSLGKKDMISTQIVGPSLPQKNEKTTILNIHQTQPKQNLIYSTKDEQ